MDHLSSCTVLMITHTEGPSSTHVTVGKDAGLTDDCFVNTTEIYTMKQSSLKKRLGQISFTDLRTINRMIKVNLDLDFPPVLAV